MSGYIGTQPVPQSTQTRQTFTATASQTSFATGGYQAGYIDVFLNGVKLVDGTDFTATNGSDVVLTTGAASGDTLEVVAYSTYEVNSQNYTGGLTVSQSASGAGGWNEALVLKGTYPLLALHETTTDKYSRIGNDGDGSLQFFVNGTSGTVGTNAASIDPSGNLYLSGGVYLGGTGAANKLDDYEEGTWLPTMFVGSTEVSYTTREGFYQKINDVVTLTFQLSVSSHSGSGALQIRSLPFTVKNTSAGGGRGGSAIGYYQGLANGAPHLMGDSNTTVATLRKPNGGGDFTQTDLGGANFAIYAAVTYAV